MTRNKIWNFSLFLVMLILGLVFLAPIIIVLLNSFKSRFYISQTPFVLPNKETFVGLENYFTGIVDTGFLTAFLYSLFITVSSVLVIVIFTSMTAWFIIRSKDVFSNIMYYLFVFSMIVPFQMVMFSMSKVANVLGLDNPIGIVVLYLGFGSGLSVFMFAGFVKTVPRGVEEAAIIDGCNVFELFWKVVFHLLRPTAITVAILNTMWIWNDYLLPYLVIGSDYKTIPIAIQYLKGGYGSVDMGAMMAMLVLAIVPVIIFYLSCQKYIIKGVAAGAIKG